MSKRDLLSGQYTCDYCGVSIPSGTGVHNGNVKIKERFCSPRCKMKWNEDNNGKHSEPVQKQSGFVSGLTGIAKSIDKGLDKNAEKEKQKRIEIENEARQIASLEFSNSPDEISNQLSDLMAYNASLKSIHYPIKKAIYYKIKLGILHLKSHNDSDIALYFEENLESIKPKWYQKLWYLIDGM